MYKELIGANKKKKNKAPFAFLNKLTIISTS